MVTLLLSLTCAPLLSVNVAVHIMTSLGPEVCALKESVALVPSVACVV